jgi:hypothetical protein
MKSDLYTRITFTIVLSLIVITQGLVIHASQDLIKIVPDIPASGMIPMDLLKHYP